MYSMRRVLVADLSHVELIVPYPGLVPDPNAFYLPASLHYLTVLLEVLTSLLTST
jgi:hypothetical protein